MPGVDEMYERARGGGVVVDRTGRGLLRLSGPQAIWFLQQTVTADVDDLETGRWRESCFLTPKGKIVAHFRVGRLDDEVFLDVDPPADELADWFVKYRFRTKVDVEDRSTAVSTLTGRRATDLVEDGEVARRDGAVVFGGRLGDLRIADAHGVQPSDPASPEVLEIFRIEAGIGRFGVDYTSDNLPQEAGLTPIVPIDKGCYVGQETVARIHFRGHVNRVLRPLELNGVDLLQAPGRHLDLNGARIGVITSAARSPRRGGVGIGMVRVEPAAGVEADVEGEGTAVLGPVPEGTKVKAD